MNMTESTQKTQGFVCLRIQYVHVHDFQAVILRGNNELK